MVSAEFRAFPHRAEAGLTAPRCLVGICLQEMTPQKLTKPEPPIAGWAASGYDPNMLSRTVKNTCLERDDCAIWAQSLSAMGEGYWKKLLSQKLTPIMIHRPHASIYMVDDAVGSKGMVVIVGGKVA